MKCLAVALALCLCGCATDYQRHRTVNFLRLYPAFPSIAGGLSFAGGGYRETQLGESVFRVDFYGNLFTSAERSGDFALLRGAELALANGFPYFEVVDRDDLSTTRVIEGTTTSGELTQGVVPTTKAQRGEPGSRVTVSCTREKPNRPAYDAADVVKSMKKKYRLW